MPQWTETGKERKGDPSEVRWADISPIPMPNAAVIDASKIALAFGWHLTDTILDVVDAPRYVRTAWAGIGLAWSAYWAVNALRK